MPRLVSEIVEFSGAGSRPGLPEWALAEIAGQMGRDLLDAKADYTDFVQTHMCLEAYGWGPRLIDLCLHDAVLWARRNDERVAMRLADRMLERRQYRAAAADGAKRGAIWTAAIILAATLATLAAAALIGRASAKAAWDVTHAQQQEAALWWK